MEDLNDIFSEARKGTLKEKPERLDKWMTVLESRLGDSTFFGGADPGIADFMGVFAFEWVHKDVGTEYGDKSPKIAKWWEDMNQVEALKKMRDSGVPMLPSFL